MIQRGQRLRFARESRQAVRIMRERLGQDLDRDVAIELRIAHAIDLSHPPFTDLGCHFVDAEPGTGGEGQRWRDYKGERNCGPDRSCKTPQCLLTGASRIVLPFPVPGPVRPPAPPASSGAR